MSLDPGPPLTPALSPAGRLEARVDLPGPLPSGERERVSAQDQAALPEEG